ncbi:protein NagD [Hyaloraphidium curvatum]|nr:protein NagD [Hyaloraphidium curvatum]
MGKPRSRAFLFDMDGVLYRGDSAIPAALDFMRAIRDVPHIFLTNNSSVTPEAVAAKLKKLGFDGIPAELILTSAMATASYLARETADFRYFAIGGPGLHAALAAVGKEDLTDPDYVVVGEGPGLTYESLTLGLGLLVRGRAKLIGTNPDANVDGTVNGKPAVLPGGGALVAPFAAGSGKEPIFIGKPAPSLYLEALRRLDAVRPEDAIMVGDRPDTDIKGAAELGIRTVLVRTGRFGPGEPYPKGLPKPDYDIASLAELPLDNLL